jgi:DNA-binding CsgD family transcriptional regulator
MHVWRNGAAVREIAEFLGTDAGSGPGAATRRSARRSHAGGLSDREADVVRLLAMGRTNQQIADELFVSAHTVSYHLRNIFAKIGVSNRTEVAAFAFQTGLASRD